MNQTQSFQILASDGNSALNSVYIIEYLNPCLEELGIRRAIDYAKVLELQAMPNFKILIFLSTIKQETPQEIYPHQKDCHIRFESRKSAKIFSETR